MERPQQTSRLSTQPASGQSQKPENSDSSGSHGLPGIGAVLSQPPEEPTQDDKQKSSNRSSNSHMVRLDLPPTRDRRRKVVDDHNGRSRLCVHLVVLQSLLDVVKSGLKVERSLRWPGDENTGWRGSRNLGNHPGSWRSRMVSP